MHKKQVKNAKHMNNTKQIKWRNLIILLFLAFIIVPISFSKYTSTLSEILTLNVRKPEYTVKFYPNRDILPDGYIEVGYLETDGSQYINLGNKYPISENTRIELGASFDRSWIYGYTEGDTGRYGSTMRSQYTGTAQVDFEESLDYRNYIFDHSAGTIIDGITYSYNGTPSGSSGTNDIYLFRANGSTVFVEGKIYYFRQYENNELVYNLIPCYREADSVKGMYDLVSDTFFTNTGTGEFEIGYPSQEFTYGTPQNLAANNYYTKEEYTFAGWNTKQDGSGTTYTDGQEVNNLTAIDGDEIKLYAQWEENTYIVSYLSENLLEEKELEQFFTSSGSGDDTISVTEGVYTIKKSTAYTGLYIPENIFENGKTYLFNYNLKKTEGTLVNIGGHAQAANQKLFTIDGQNSITTYDQPKDNLTNNTEVHTVDFKFEYDSSLLSTSSDGNIYIQVNRNKTDSLTVNISEVALYEVIEEKEYKYGDALGNLPEVTRDGYVFTGWYTEKEGGTLVDSNTNVKTVGEYRLYARWKKM